jgi:hypothetical protein
MDLLGDVGHVESCFNPFGDSVTVGARLVHDLRQTYHTLIIILDAPDGKSLLTRHKWKLNSICIERTIGSEIVLDVSDGTPR